MTCKMYLMIFGGVFIVATLIGLEAPSAYPRISQLALASTIDQGATQSDFFRSEIDNGQTASFQRMQARDLTFSVDLPQEWQVTGSPTFESATAFSGAGETYSSGWPEVYASRELLMVNLQAYRTILPTQQIVLMSRMLAPPLSADQIVGRLFLQIANGAIQNMHVLQSVPVLNKSTVNVTLVHYQYSFLPRRDAAFASIANPSLLNQVNVPMEAAVVITTLPINRAGGSWSFGFSQVSAPQAVWGRNQASYGRILESFQFNAQALAAKVRINTITQELAAQMNETTRRVGLNYSCVLGGNYSAQPWWQNRIDGTCACQRVPPEPAGDWIQGCPSIAKR